MCKPNEPVVLDDTSITHIQDQCLSTPCKVRAVLRLSPRLQFSIDSDEYPLFMRQRFMYEPFFISLKSGGRIRVKLKSCSLNKDSVIGFKGSLGPVQSPCTVARSDVRLKSVRFGILNFITFYGAQDKHIEIDGVYRRLGFAILEVDHWRIEIKENRNFFENQKILKQSGGYAITHTGAIYSLNNKVFTVGDVLPLIDGLGTFFSFARGTACGLTSVKGIDVSGGEQSILWGTKYVTHWQESRHTWLAKHDGGGSLSGSFRGFWELYTKEEWKDAIRRAIDWYVNSAGSAIHVGIVLTQAALESLSYIINQETVYSFGKSLKKTLEELEIEAKIPSHCKHLEAIAKRRDGRTVRPR